MIEYTNLNRWVNHVVYIPFYVSKSHPKYSAQAQTFMSEVKG